MANPSAVLNSTTNMQTTEENDTLQAWYGFLSLLVSQATDIPVTSFFRNDRKADASVARMLVAYLAATGLDWSYRKVAQMLCKDRTTIPYYIEQIMHARERDPDIDAICTTLEAILHKMPKTKADAIEQADQQWWG